VAQGCRHHRLPEGTVMTGSSRENYVVLNRAPRNQETLFALNTT
jgi:hypothetical protein